MRIIFFKKPLITGLISVLFLTALTSCFLFYYWSSIPAIAINDGQPVYQGSSERKQMAFTCNVFWGEEFLPEMLAIFRDHEVPVTFFVSGTWAERFPEITTRLFKEKHEIANHGYAHPHPDRLSKEDNLKDILKCEHVLKEITGTKPVLYAPPYGERGPAVLQAAQEAGYRTILWSIDTADWKHPRPETIINKVTKDAHNGAIVLMHPTAPTVAALPSMIEKLKAKGFSLVTISDLLQGEKVKINN